MKSFSINITYDQLNEWSRRHIKGTITPGRSLEALFRILYPGEVKFKGPTYERRSRSDFYTCVSEDGKRKIVLSSQVCTMHGDGFNVVQIDYYVLLVSDDEGNAESIYPALEREGLTGGDELISAELAEVKQRWEKHARNYRLIVAGFALSFLAIIVAVVLQ